MVLTLPLYLLEIGWCRVLFNNEYLTILLLHKDIKMAFPYSVISGGISHWYYWSRLIIQHRLAGISFLFSRWFSTIGFFLLRSFFLIFPSIRSLIAPWVRWGTTVWISGIWSPSLLFPRFFFWADLDFSFFYLCSLCSMFFPSCSWDTSFIDDVVANPFRLGSPSSERENIERGWEA